MFMSSKFSSYPRKHLKLYKLVLADRKLKLHEIVGALKISEGSVFITEQIGATESTLIDFFF